MRKFILYSLFSLGCLALAGCAGDGREEREPANALLLEGLMAGAMADCTNRLAAGEFTTHVERARCEGEEAHGSVEGLGMEYAFGDLVALLSEWRLRLARERDAGTLDAAGERTRQKEFDAAYLREMDVRERLHNDGVRYIEFNVCEIEGNGLRCTQTDMGRIQQQIDTHNAECEWDDRMGFSKTGESYTRCLYEEGLVTISERNHFPHIKLTKLYAEYMVVLSRNWDKGEVTKQQLQDNTDAISNQYYGEIKRRDNLRAAGDLNWRRQDCRLSNNQLVC